LREKKGWKAGSEVRESVLNKGQKKVFFLGTKARPFASRNSSKGVGQAKPITATREIKTEKDVGQEKKTRNSLRLPGAGPEIRYSQH